MTAVIKKMPGATGEANGSVATVAGKRGAFGFGLGLFLRASVIALATAWIYWPALRGEWVWDDTLLVTENQVVHDPAGWWKIWLQPASLYDYQPLKFSVVWLQWHLWGDNTLGYHLTNVVLHILSALLVWRLLGKLGLRLAWLGGLIFAVHPVQVESVAWISELKNTLSLPPFLLAMCAYLDFDERGRWRDYALSLVLFAVAMLCKTTMVMFPFVILLYALWKRSRVARRDLLASAPFFMISLVLGFATIWAEHHHGAGTSLPSQPVSPLTRLVLAGHIIWFGIAKFAWPVGVAPTYPLGQIDAGSPLSYASWLALAAGLFWCWQKRAGWGRGALLGLGFFLLNLLPAITFLIVKYLDAVWSLDHLFYLPLIGMVGLLVAALERVDEKWPGYGRLGWIVPLTVATLLMVTESRAYASVFSTGKTLWTYALQRNPNSITGHMNLGQILFAEGRFAESAEHFQQVLGLAPAYAKARYDLANSLNHLGKTSEAIQEYETAVQIQPNFAEAHYNLANTLAKAGRVSEAIDEYNEALANSPSLAKAHVNLGQLLHEQGRLAESLEQYQQAVQLEPDKSEPRFRLAEVLMQTGRAAEAMEQCDLALQADPGHAEGYFMRGNLEMFGGKPDAARDDFDKAIQFDPHLAEAYFRRGLILHMNGDWGAALADFQEGCRQVPKDPLADYARLSIWVLQVQQQKRTEADRDLASALQHSWNAAATDWETTLAKYLLGQVTEEGLLATAQAASTSNQIQLCEAWYFAGVKALAGGDKVRAISDLQKCVATGQLNSTKYKLAQAELQTLDSP